MRKEVLFKYKQLHSKGRRKNMQGPGDGPYTSTAQGQSVGTWGRDPPSPAGAQSNGNRPPPMLGTICEKGEAGTWQGGLHRSPRGGQISPDRPLPRPGPEKPKESRLRVPGGQGQSHPNLCQDGAHLSLYLLQEPPTCTPSSPLVLTAPPSWRVVTHRCHSSLRQQTPLSANCVLGPHSPPGPTN